MPRHGRTRRRWPRSVLRKRAEMREREAARRAEWRRRRTRSVEPRDDPGGHPDLETSDPA